MTINQLVEKHVAEELGAARLEIVKLKAINAAQGAEIARLKEHLAMATAKEPELPLEKPEGVSNGARH